MRRELKRLEEEPKAEIHTSLLKTTLKNITLENARPRWNIWFLVQEIYLHSRQISTRNKQMSTRSTCVQIDDQRKDHIDPKTSPQRNCSKQLQTHNLCTYDVENANGINEGIDLLLANKSNGLFPKRNRKDITNDRKARESYSILIRTSSRRARRNGKI